MPSYREAGVDLEAAERHISEIAEAVTGTWSDRVVGVFGDFAAGVELPGGYRQPVVTMSTDGVGTKLEIARLANQWSGVGIDLVAMCVDDLAAVGAEPLGFVDYMAVESLDLERDRTIVESLARGCDLASCPLLGGETAEHPGVMPPGGVDLAGAAVGIVERSARLGPHLVEKGDVVLGLRSPNLRSNGFSLVRVLFQDDILDHATPLLDPSVIYSPAVLSAVRSGAVHAAAHITGGGIASNLKRVMPSGLGVEIDTGAWEPPRIFSDVGERGVDRAGMFETFNMGIGFCLIVDPASIGEALDAVRIHDPVEIGRVEPGDGVLLR